MQAPLRNRFRDLPEADMKEILHQRMWETESYKTHEDHSLLFEALENSMNRDHSEELAQDLAKARKKKRKRRESPKTPPGSPPHQPPPPHPPTRPSRPSEAPGASGSQVTPPPPHPPPSTNLDMDEAMGPDEQVQLSDDEDIGSAHIPTVNLRQDWWKPLEEERIATPEPAWSIPSSDAPVTLNNWASALASDYSPPPEDSLLAQTGNVATFIDWFYKRQECHKLLTNSMDNSIPRNNVSKPLPLGGPPGHVTIQSDFFFNKDLKYLRYKSKGNRPALSISKIKATHYPDVRLEQMVPDQFWINEESKYDIAIMYGISHWWFQRKRFYIDRHTSEGDRNTVRTHMRILSVDKYGVQMMMRLNEIHKFSDETLQQIDEALDYRFKEFRINRMNPGLNTRFWTRKDVDRCKAFMFAIQRHLRLRRIYRNLESFVGKRLREGDY
nr:hypothetical protein [Tanacetum cinerariifolium]